MSDAYNSAGNPLGPSWEKDGKEGLPGEFAQSLTRWMSRTFYIDNYGHTASLKASHRFKTMTPLNIVKDHENRYHVFLNGELDDKRRVWNIEYEQAKWIENAPGVPTLGDFSPLEFNNDFLT